MRKTHLASPSTCHLLDVAHPWCQNIHQAIPQSCQEPNYSLYFSNLKYSIIYETWCAKAGWADSIPTITQISAPYLPMLSSYFCLSATAENGCSQHPFRVHCTWFFNGGGISPVCAALMIYLSLPSFCYCFAMRSKGSPKSQETLKVEVFLLRVEGERRSQKKSRSSPWFGSLWT